MVGQQVWPTPAKHVAKSDLARALIDLLGERITAVIAGVTDPQRLRAWARGATPPTHAERHRREAYEIASLLLQHEETDSVRSWFVGSEPRLDDRAPALVLADDPATVARVARAFLATG